MKGNKCFGLLLLFSIIFGLSLSVSSDTNALSYNYSSLYLPHMVKLYQNNSENYYFNASFEDEYISQSNIPASLWTRYFMLYSPEYETDVTNNLLFAHPTFYPMNGNCTINTDNPARTSLSSSDWENGFVADFTEPWLFTSYDTTTANAFKTDFGYNSCYLYSSDPDWLSYSSIYLHSRYTSSFDDGIYFSPEVGVIGQFTITDDNPSPGNVIHNYYLNFSDISGYSSGRFYGFGLPLTFNQSVTGQITRNRSLQFVTDFTFNNEIQNLNTTTAVAKINYYGLTTNYQYKTGTINCSMVYYDVPGMTSRNAYYDLQTTCDFISPYDFLNIDFVIYFAPGYDSDVDDSIAYYPSVPNYSSGLFDFTDDFEISFHLITDGDDTSSTDDISISPIGYDLQSAPGNADDTGTDNMFDLTDLFNFTSMNPFTPIFALFTNQSTCANIPTIASMLHSNETQVCPWFSGTTRAIVTPIVGVASLMLVFGFFVRWLGGSSGNMFADAGHIEPPGGYTADVRGRNVKRRGWRVSK